MGDGLGGNGLGNRAAAPTQSGYRCARSVCPWPARWLAPLAIGFPELSIFTRSLIIEYTPKLPNYTDVVIFDTRILKMGRNCYW
jgi:hypothetical protein